MTKTASMVENVRSSKPESSIVEVSTSGKKTPKTGTMYSSKARQALGSLAETAKLKGQKGAEGNG